MALTLPGWLVEAISYIGYDFPQTNEDVLHQWADHLKSLDHTMDTAHTDLLGAIQRVKDDNRGPAAETFDAYVSGSEGDASALARFGQGCEVASLGCDICGYAVVTLKGVILFQLALLAPAIVAGPVSFMVKKGIEYLINVAINEAITKLLD